MTSGCARRSTTRWTSPPSWPISPGPAAFWPRARYRPGLAGYDSTRARYSYDPAEARRLLAEAGYADGLTLKLWRSQRPEYARIVQAMQQDLAQVGVTIEIVERDASSARAAARKGEADLFFTDWYGDYPDAENFNYPLFYSGNRGPGGNLAFLADSALDAMILTRAGHHRFRPQGPARPGHRPAGLRPGPLDLLLVPGRSLGHAAGDHRLADPGHLQRAALAVGAPPPAMIRWLAIRLLLLLPTLLGVLVVAFLLLYVAPGDPVQAMVGERADSATIAQLRTELRLDDPLPVQFAHYVGGVLHGNLGNSYITRRPILGDLLERFPATLRLATAAMLLATTTGMLIGIYGAWRPGSWGDRIATFGAYLGVSFPVYWVALVLILVFAVSLRWLPPSGSTGLAALVLPAITLGMRSIAFIARMTRSAMQEVLQQRLRAHRPGPGAGRVEGDPVARPAERTAPGDHRDRPRLRQLPHRLDPDRDDLRLAGRRPLRAHRHRQA